ncbi:MAG: hypothetical protein Q9217_003793 [Psora testacea]
MTTPTSQRKSFGRPRPTLKTSKINSTSSPALSSAFASPKLPPLPLTQPPSSRRPTGSGASANRKISFGPYSLESPSAISESREGYGLITAEQGGSSPFTLHPPTLATMRTASDDRNGNQNLEVGDTVDVPGGMHGTIKFIGEVKGKKGIFTGVELAKEWAARGKNDGDVDGIRYFTTSIKGAGIFLPSNKAYKRLSPPLSSPDSVPPTPTTPSLAALNLGSPRDDEVYTPPTPSAAPKFSQSVGPGRGPSPTTKAKRPSLSRPESPQRKSQNPSLTSQARPSIGKPNLSKSILGGSRYAPSPTPGKLGASMRGIRDVAGDPGKRLPVNPKPAIRKPTGLRPSSRSESRSESRLGPEAMFDDESDKPPIGVAKTAYTPRPTQQMSRPVSKQDDELKLLRSELEQRDKQLEKYAADLEEMQSSLAELQSVSVKRSSAMTRSSRGSGIDDLDAPSLRVLVREKNEKITALTNEFDTHRADFRDTIDILEHTSDETNRHYEDRIANLEDELRNQNNRDDDVESVAQQLILLEKQVEDLEEGLEDSRRGESEARGEVEHLRGEVERGRAELRREKERTAAALKAGVDGSSEASLQREIAHRDNELNGLKAIIHSLSRDASATSPSSPKSSRRLKRSSHSQPNGHIDAQLTEERQAREKLEQQIKDLESLVDRKTYREQELEHEIQRLRTYDSHVSTASNGYSERTVMTHNYQRQKTSEDSQLHNWRDQPPLPQPEQNLSVSNLDSMPESDTHSTTMTESSALWCEMCETTGHDILHCASMGSEPPHHSNNHSNDTDYHNPTRSGQMQLNDKLSPNPHLDDFPAPLSPSRSPAPGSGRDARAPDLDTPKAQQARIPDPMDNAMVAGKESGVIDGSKWCALCERDGHESVDCPFDDAY